MNYNKSEDKNSTYKPPVNPYDIKHHRGQANRDECTQKSMNRNKEKMAQVIQNYTKGNLDLNNFRAELNGYGIKMDADLDKLIRKHESGDFQSYNAFGKKIYRQLNGTDFYNRPDKVNMNSKNLISPEKTGTSHFKMQEEVKQPSSRKMDNLHIEKEQRHVGS